MNENPYASPAELPKEPSEEEKYARGLRRLQRGVGWISWSCVPMATLPAIRMLEITGVLKYSGSEVVFGIWCLCVAAILCFPVMQLTGLILCCFCPAGLVKRGRRYVLGSLGLLGAAVLVPVLIGFIDIMIFTLGDPSHLLTNILMIGWTASTVVWLIFLLRLARGLQSTAGIWLARSVIVLLGMLAAGVIAHTNIELYYYFRYTYESPWKDYWQANKPPLEILLIGMTIVYCGVYAGLLNTLRRRIVCSLQFVVCRQEEQT